MPDLDKKSLSERDICTKFITPALVAAGWDVQTQVREEVSFTKGRIIVRGKMTSRGESKRADYILYHASGAALALIEAKDNHHSVGAGMQQALGYAETLQIPFVFSSNGDGFLFHDRTVAEGIKEQHLPLSAFPSPAELWARHTDARGIPTARLPVVAQPFHDDGSGKRPRYYQEIAVNRAVEAVARGDNRLLLVMATGTGKTYVAFQIIWRLWKAGVKKRILFLADRNILVDQTRVNDFKPFGAAMTKITNRKVDKSYEIYLALYQAVSGTEAEDDIYRQFSPDFFDLVVIDECHRGSAAEDANWRRILDYFSSATHLGLTATPKETKEVSNTTYFGEPIYTYSLRQGIEDGFLAPYKVVRIHLDKDLTGWRPTDGQTDKAGAVIPDRIYNQKDFDRELVLEKRTLLVARKITEFLKLSGDRFAKTIVFCEDVEHAERMRQALANENADLVTQNHRYQLNTLADVTVIETLADLQVLPRYGFPIGLSKLRVVAASDSQNKGPIREEDQLRLERSGLMALREYVPGSRLMAGGRMVTSRGLLKHWTGSDIDNGFGLRGVTGQCANNHRCYSISKDLDDCPLCAQPILPQKEPILIPKHGYTTAAWDPPRFRYDAEVVGHLNRGSRQQECVRPNCPAGRKVDEPPDHRCRQWR